jgi:hypothetical protein
MWFASAIWGVEEAGEIALTDLDTVRIAAAA